MSHKPITGWQWLKRVALSLLALLLLVLIAWGYWWQEMRRRCDAAIAQMRARGEPVLISDRLVADVPDEQNALWYLTQASASLPARRSAPAWPGLYSADDIAQHTNSLELLRKARQCTRSSVGTTGLANVTELSRLAGDAAILAHKRGDDVTAIDRWQDVETIPRSFTKGPVLLIGGLLAVITDQMSTEVMLHLAPTLHISDADGVPLTEATTLVRQLENDTGPGDACARGFLSERVGFTDAYLTGKVPLAPWPLQPMRLHHLAKVWDDITRLGPEFRGEVPPSPPRYQPPEERLTSSFVPQFMGVTQDAQQGMVRRRLAAATLAIRLFHARTGRYPQALQELVPDYLTHIPVDPRTTARRPLGYALMQNGERPVLWCAGSSTATDQAIQRGIPATPTGVPPAAMPMNKVIYFDASGWALPPSAQQRAADQHKKPNAPGDQQKPEEQVQQ